MTATPPAPTITIFDDPSPCPRAEVLISPMPSDAVSITVYRTWAGQRAVVRGANNTPCAGDFLVVDYEMPFGVDVNYTCQTADVDGSPSELSEDSDPYELDVAEIWLQDPLDPTTSMAIPLNANDDAFLEAGAFQTLTYSAQATTVTPVLGGPLPVAYAGTRQAASNIPISFLTPDVYTTAALRILLTQAFPVCMRNPQTVPMFSGLTYLTIGDIIETPRKDLSSLWAMQAQIVASPGTGLIISPRTWDDVIAEASTWSELIGIYPTWLDVIRG